VKDQDFKDAFKVIFTSKKVDINNIDIERNFGYGLFKILPVEWILVHIKHLTKFKTNTPVVYTRFLLNIHKQLLKHEKKQ